MKKLRMEDLELGPVIGTGTVGTIYKAVLKSTGETVALKILQQAVSKDALVKARFVREMEILQRLQHPNIIKYFGGGEHEGQLFFAMELIDGGTVRDLLERFSYLSWQEVASCGRQICSALQHAHNYGIIHRDLKPSNLFLTKTGELKLGDFGIARDVHSADLTVTGLTVGTHSYMPPEQITGSPSINGKADLYSLGCVLFEMLTGHKPFQAENFAHLFEQHLRKIAPRVRQYMPDCPQQMDDIVAQLLEKDPERRPFNARTVQGVMLQLLAATAPPTESKVRDVAAAMVIDPGLQSLSRKLSMENATNDVSWMKLAMVTTIAVIVIAVAAIFNSR
jgi:eukaryotic-like serine/threonine-protein kinase